MSTIAEHALVVARVAAHDPTNPFLLSYITKLPSAVCFQLAVTSIMHCKIVLKALRSNSESKEEKRAAAKLRRLGRIANRRASGSATSRVPLEVWQLVVQSGDIVSMGNLGATCTELHLVINAAIEAVLSIAFKSIGLSLPELRYNLAVNDALMGGWAAARLLQPGSASTVFCGLSVVDFFVEQENAEGFVHFFQVALSCREYATVSPHSSMTHIVHVRMLELCRPQAVTVKIAVHVCKLDPRTAVFRQGFSPQFINFDGKALTVPHYSLALDRVALPNHVYIPDDLSSAVDYDLLEAEHAAHTNGFRALSCFDALESVPGAYKLQTTAGGDCATFILRCRTLARGSQLTRRPVHWRLQGLEDAVAGTGAFLVKRVDVPLTNDKWLLKKDARLNVWSNIAVE
ncbi:hypothetical protein C8F01DRAFT_1088246 [Mycena amicta]|nr:hypothetical protein C8F01DRAFT_1088246 [Mycena amicta]